MARAILDGEVCALDKKGRSSFQLLQNAADVPPRLVYYVFDILFEGKKDLRELPLLKRKERLEVILLNAVAPIRPSLYFTQNPARILQKMREAGAEGSIAKRIDSAYEVGQRSGAWIKIKFHKAQEFVVAGYTLPQKSRQHFGSLILGYYEGKRLIFAGHVGTGFNHRSLKEIFARLKKLQIDSPMGRTNPGAIRPLARERVEGLRMPLGETGARGAGAVHRMDRGWHPAPSLLPRPARG